MEDVHTGSKTKKMNLGFEPQTHQLEVSVTHTHVVVVVVSISSALFAGPTTKMMTTSVSVTKTFFFSDLIHPSPKKFL